MEERNQPKLVPEKTSRRSQSPNNIPHAIFVYSTFHTQIYMSKVVSTSITRPVRKASARISLVDWDCPHQLSQLELAARSSDESINKTGNHLSLEKARSRMRPISQHPHPSSLGRLAGAHKQCISSASLGLSCCPLTASSFNSELKDSPTEHQIHKACLWLVSQSLQLIYLICLSFG